VRRELGAAPSALAGLPHEKRHDLTPVAFAPLGRESLATEVIHRGGCQPRDARLGPERLWERRPGLLVGRVLPVVGCLPRRAFAMIVTVPDTEPCLTAKTAWSCGVTFRMDMPALSMMDSPSAGFDWRCGRRPHPCLGPGPPSPP
jgi:hypothetical protein